MNALLKLFTTGIILIFLLTALPAFSQNGNVSFPQGCSVATQGRAATFNPGVTVAVPPNSTITTARFGYAVAAPSGNETVTVTVPSSPGATGMAATATCPSVTLARLPNGTTPIIIPAGLPGAGAVPLPSGTSVAFPPGADNSYTIAWVVPTGGVIAVDFIPASPNVNVTINGLGAPITKVSTMVSQKFSYPSGGKMIFKNVQKNVSGKLATVLNIDLTGTGVKPVK